MRDARSLVLGQITSAMTVGLARAPALAIVFGCRVELTKIEDAAFRLYGLSQGLGSCLPGALLTGL